MIVSSSHSNFNFILETVCLLANKRTIRSTFLFLKLLRKPLIKSWVSLVCKKFPMASGWLLNLSSFTSKVQELSELSIGIVSCSAIALFICMVSACFGFGSMSLRSLEGNTPRPNTKRVSFLHLLIIIATCTELITKLLMVILWSSVRFSTTQYQSFMLRKHSSKDRCRVLRVGYTNKVKNTLQKILITFWIQLCLGIAHKSGTPILVNVSKKYIVLD